MDNKDDKTIQQTERQINYAKAKARGECPDCGDKVPELRYTYCRKCRGIRAARQAKYRGK